MTSWVCVISADFLCLFVTLVHFSAVFALKSLTPYILHASDRLVQLERKVWKLEQEKSLETTEGTLTSLRRYLNRPNSAFDRFEVLDLVQVFMRLARTQAHHIRVNTGLVSLCDFLVLSLVFVLRSLALFFRKIVLRSPLGSWRLGTRKCSQEHPFPYALYHREPNPMLAP